MLEDKISILENYNQNEYQNEKSFFSLSLLSEVKTRFFKDTDILRESGKTFGRKNHIEENY